MEKFLSICRWILHKAFIALLGATIWTFIPLMAFSINFTKVEQVKTWLVESDTYELLVDESLSFIKLEDEGQVIADGAEQSSIDSAALLAAVKPVLPASFVQAQIESVIDGTYAWLRSETSQPEFSVSLNEKSAEIEKALTVELTSQLKKLPLCTTLEQATIAAFDILAADCLPPGIPVEQQAQLFASSFVNQKDGPIQSEFTGEDLKLGETTKLSAPVAFNTLELLPMFFWIFLLSFAAIVLLTSKTLKQGLRELGLTLLVASGTLTLISFVSLRLSSAPGKYFIKPEGGDTQSQAVRNIFEPLAKNVTSDVSSTGIKLSLAVFGLGAVILAIGLYLSHNDKKKTDPADPNQPAKKEDEVPELMRDDHSINFIDHVHEEKNAKPKIRDKLKKKLIQ